MLIETLPDIETHLAGLSALLTDCVDSGASVGFISPLEEHEADDYWRSLQPSLTERSRCLLIAREQGQIAGAIQLALCQKKNGLHRAEVEKLMVHTAFRRQGIARQLLTALETLAAEHQRTLLVLDTRTGDNASLLYRSEEYQQVGTIPEYVTNAAGEMESTTYFYKSLNRIGEDL
ncbi:GNAT family N-acetyltransferase [Tatumella saanichensis]|uniref:GNAT family N-acetyltransferase n=1 Tax=Tatumella saanichensis TaxID=480813 RepID=UPI0004A2DB35|nr:GNAT family N-acetyltransferase [Tatumella saanichensis]